MTTGRINQIVHIWLEPVGGSTGIFAFEALHMLRAVTQPEPH